MHRYWKNTLTKICYIHTLIFFIVFIINAFNMFWIVHYSSLSQLYCILLCKFILVQWCSWDLEHSNSIPSTNCQSDSCPEIDWAIPKRLSPSSYANPWFRLQYALVIIWLQPDALRSSFFNSLRVLWCLCSTLPAARLLEQILLPQFGSWRHRRSCWSFMNVQLWACWWTGNCQSYPDISISYCCPKRG